MNKRLLLLVVVSLIIVLSAYFLLSILPFYNNLKVLEEKEIGMRLIITNDPYEIRFGNSTDFVDFGVSLGGQKNKAHLTITNNYDKTVLITIKKSGELSKSVEMNQNKFLLDPNQSKWVLLEATLPERTATGEYTGLLSITQSIT